ncbi:pdz domain protein [Nannochloropsis oceanica]
MKLSSATVILAAALLSLTSAFVLPVPGSSSSSSTSISRTYRPKTTTTFASGGSSEFNKNRAARKPGPMDLVVELQKPLGIVLEEDEKGNVYVKELSPAGNAARSGKVEKGDLVTMISATFGDECWSARGAGLGMIMQAIKVRQGNSVKIVLERAKKVAPKKNMFSTPAPKPKPAPVKPDEATLLKQLEAEEKGKKKFFGLF